MSGGTSDLGGKLLFSVCFSRRVVSDLIGRDFNIFREKIGGKSLIINLLKIPIKSFEMTLPKVGK